MQNCLCCPQQGALRRSVGCQGGRTCVPAKTLRTGENLKNTESLKLWNTGDNSRVCQKHRRTHRLDYIQSHSLSRRPREEKQELILHSVVAEGRAAPTELRLQVVTVMRFASDRSERAPFLGCLGVSFRERPKRGSCVLRLLRSFRDLV